MAYPLRRMSEGATAKAAGAAMLAMVALVAGPDVFGQLMVNVTDGPPDRLSKDAVYMGSLTFAGLALFGSVMMIKALSVTRYDSLKQNVGAMVVFTGTLFLVILHVLFAFGQLSISEEVAAWATVCALIWTVLGGGMIAPKLKEMFK